MSLLQELNDFSLRIRQAIESSDWKELSEVLTQRQARLEILLNTSTQEEQRTIQGVLESVQAMDKLFIDAVQLQKTELLKEFQAVTHRQKSIRAYYTA